MRSWGFEGESLYVYDDAGQVIIEAAYAVAGSAAAYYFRLVSTDATVGSLRYTGQGHVTDLSISFATNEVVTYSISIEGTGTLTKVALT